MIKNLLNPRASIRMGMEQVNYHLREFLSEAGSLDLPERVKPLDAKTVASVYADHKGSHYVDADAQPDAPVYCEGSSVYLKI
mmetsp:Transcript_17768/g.34700  ORF Transcript_17768/g.34700 Transcript_17768/m.34700 type:complete len:82 (-) Transcript_17768:82-327(-)